MEIIQYTLKNTPYFLRKLKACESPKNIKSKDGYSEWFNREVDFKKTDEHGNSELKYFVHTDFEDKKLIVVYNDFRFDSGCLYYVPNNLLQRMTLGGFERNYIIESSPILFIYNYDF